MNHYLLAAYTIASLLLWGYAISMWRQYRVVAQRISRNRKPGGRP